MPPLHRFLVLGLGSALILLVASPASADSSGPIRPAPDSSTTTPSAVEEYNQGLRLRASKNWPSAVSAFRRATELRPAFPEAWNELGYSLRQQGKYSESVAAYDEALKLRPSYPEALEYLGEAYVKMRRLDDARRILERLRPLDAERAQDLAEQIDKAP